MTAVLIMARAPRPGAAKTRLERLLGRDGCARLQTALIRHTAEWVARASTRPWLAFTPADAGAELAVLVPSTVELFPQDDGDLGRRLRHATDHVMRHERGPVVVVGTDAPTLGPAHVRFAEHALDHGGDACIVPAYDGGYALLALAEQNPAAFDLPSESWGGPHVLELTLEALHASGSGVALLDPVRDLDTPADARQVASDPRCPAAIKALLVRGSRA